jgi:hypothetical protein
MVKGGEPLVIDAVIVKFRRFLPAGPVASSEPSSADGIRPRHLIQINTDPGGLRTVEAAAIELKKPRKKAADE